eukprot:jgi/Mesvir1/14088/Mv05738-RA.1
MSSHVNSIVAGKAGADNEKVPLLKQPQRQLLQIDQGCKQFGQPMVNAAQSGIIATNWQRTLNVTQFAAAYGTLLSVTVTLGATVQGVAAYESVEAYPFEITLNLRATIEMRMNGSTIFSESPVGSVVDNVQPYDGILNFDGPSGGSFQLSGTANRSRIFNASADLVPFRGPAGAPGRVGILPHLCHGLLRGKHHPACG